MIQKLAFTIIVFVSLLSSNSFAQASLSEVPASGPRLHVLTFNTWLLDLMGLGLASNVAARRELIAAALLNSKADVINLSEVWREESADILVARMKSVYPYCSFNPDQIRFGSFYANGLLIFSKYPLKHRGVRYHNGCTKPLDELVFSATSRLDELLVSKGAIHNVMIHPVLGAVDLFSSHLGALSFSTELNDYDISHQWAVFQQASELTAFMQRVSVAKSQLLMIDTNRHFRKWEAYKGESTKLDPTYNHFLFSGLRDSFMDAHGFDPHQLSGIYTFDQKRNPNAAEGAFSGAPSDFIDYVFFRSDRLTPIDSRLMFASPHLATNGLHLFLSDHFAVGTTFAIH